MLSDGERAKGGRCEQTGSAICLAECLAKHAISKPVHRCLLPAQTARGESREAEAATFEREAARGPTDGWNSTRATHPLAAIFLARNPFAPRVMAACPCSVCPLPCGSCACASCATCIGWIDSADAVDGAGEALVNSNVGAVDMARGETRVGERRKGECGRERAPNKARRLCDAASQVD